jgi:putative ABC transport system permease protein
VAGEVALAFVVLAWTGLIVRSFLRLQEVNPGFQPDRVITVQLFLSPTKYATDPQQAAYAARLVERLRDLPGVASAGAVSVMPLGDIRITAELAFEGRQSAPGEPVPLGDWRAATPGYFETMGIPLREGRGFSAADDAQAPAIAVVDENLARRYWPGQSPIGKRLGLSGLTPDEKWLTVVGVVGNVKSFGLDQNMREQLYTPFAQTALPFLSVVLRAKSSDPANLTSQARDAVWSIDRQQPIAAIKPVEEILADSMAGRRAYAFLMSLFASVALALAVLGIYGVVSYSVARRAFEIGVRIALGARREHVYRTVLGRAMVPILAGMALGVAGVLASNRLVQSLLFEVSPTDLPTIGGMGGLLVAVALAASLLPTYRSSRINPVLVLKRD